MIFAAELVLHPITRQVCEAFVKNPGSGVLLYGEDGCGLKTIATALATAFNPESGGIMMLEPEDDKDISIEQIRQLYHATRSVRSHQLTVIIDDAERMSIPAQNAFLKLLEEPPMSVVFVLTSHSPDQLLATIRSRVSAIEVRLITDDASHELIKKYGVDDAATRSQLMFLARGRPAGLFKLIHDREYFDHRVESVRKARDIVRGSTYQRLILSKDAMLSREAAIELLTEIGRLVTHGLQKSHTQQGMNQLRGIAEAIDALHANANVRLQVLSLVLSL